MCTIRDLYELAAPADWTAAPLLPISCEAFLASFKVWNSATVGGNICMALPAGPMITMTVALEATYTLWSVGGTERTVDAGDFVTGNHLNILEPGELLRSIHIPAGALRKRHAHRRFTLTKMGRSTIFMIGTQTPGHRRPAAHDHGGHHPPRAALVRLHAGSPTPCSTASTRSATTCGSTIRTAHPITAAISPSTTPKRSAPNSASEPDHDVHGER